MFKSQFVSVTKNMVSKGMILKGVYYTLMAMVEILFLKMLKISKIFFTKGKKLWNKLKNLLKCFKIFYCSKWNLQNQLTIWQTCAEAPLYYANLCSLNVFFFNGLSFDWCTKWVFFVNYPTLHKPKCSNLATQ